MATLSSHVLDSVIGTHASGIRVCCYRLHEDGSRARVFDVVASCEGRIAQTIQFDAASVATDYELEFHSADYYASQERAASAVQIMKAVVIRLSLTDPNAKYHVPIMLAPHSYSVWWSGMPQQAVS